MTAKKMGRPVIGGLKCERVDVRLSEEELKLLDAYCQKKGITRPQGLRDGIRTLDKK